MDELDGGWPTAGQEIRRLREGHGWTLKQLAGQLHITHGYLGRVERDEQPPPSALAERLDERFDSGKRIQQLAVHSATRRPGGLRLDRPAQLPPAPRHFVGRAMELAAIDAVLAVTEDLTGPRLVVIEALPGAGKTALARHWAQLRAGRFPDGQLYCDLHGFDRDPPVDPDDVLREWLLSLGVPSVLVPDQELGQTFRSVLADRQMLLVLDNAASSKQVVPLLPAVADCMVVVTSRVRLVGLCRQNGGPHIRLDAFHPSESLALLRRIVGQRRVDNEREAAAAIAERCGHLPHAVRAAAAHAAAHPHQTLADLLADLDSGPRALDLLSPPGDPTPLRESISWSYSTLDDPTAHLYRLLSVLPGSTFSTAAAAAALGESMSATRGRLTTLATRYLIHDADQDQWRIPGPLAWYAAERSDIDLPPHRVDRARRQGVQWYLHGMAAAARLLAPGHRLPELPPAHELRSLIPTPTDRTEALNWAEKWAPVVVDAITSAREHGLCDLAWRLAAVTAPYLRLRARWQLSLTAFSRGIQAAREVSDEATAWCHHELGTCLSRRHRHQQALEHLGAAIRLREQLDDPVNLAWSVLARAHTYASLRLTDDARSAYEHARELFADHGQDDGKVLALAGMASVDRILGHTQDALDGLHQALEISTTAGAADGQSFVYLCLADTEHALGHHQAALQHLEFALRLRRAHGDIVGEVEVLLRRGDLLYETSQPEQARNCWQQALALFDTDDPLTADIHNRLATVDARRNVSDLRSS